MHIFKTSSSKNLLIADSQAHNLHIFKTSSSKNLLIADSQARHLEFLNTNILSLPGARIAAVRVFLPPKDKYNTIVLLSGENDAFDGREPSTVPEEDIANELAELAEELSRLSKQIFVIGIPHRSEYRFRSARVNREIQKKKGNWKYRGLCEKIYSTYHLGSDEIHLSPEGLKGIKSIIKNKILYKKYSDAFNDEGHLTQYECTFRHCHCPY